MSEVEKLKVIYEEKQAKYQALCDAMMKMREQMENLAKTLESMGVEFEQHEGGMLRDVE